jgi:hypothetical protein
MDPTTNALTRTDASTADATDTTAHVAAAEETVAAKEPSTEPGEEDGKMGYLPKPPAEPSSPTEDKIGSLDGFDLAWLSPDRATKHTEVMSSLASTVTTEASQSSQVSLDTNGETDAEDTPPCKKARSLDDAAANKETVAAIQPLAAALEGEPTTGAANMANVQQLFAGNVQQLFGSFADEGANAASIAPVSAAPTVGAPGGEAPVNNPTNAPNSGGPPVELPTTATPDAWNVPPAIQPPSANPAAGAPHTGRCHNCGQEGHWATECKLILSKMIAGRVSKCALCPFPVQPNKDVIAKLGCGPFTYQWVHRPCAMEHLVTLGLLGARAF